MEKYLMNLDAWCWRYRENIRNYPGFHFTAKPAACDVLLDLTKKLRKEGNAAHRTFPLKSLNAKDEAKITGGLKYRSFTNIRIAFYEPFDQLRMASFCEQEGLACIDLTENFIEKFEEGLLDVKRGVGDYCIAPTGKKHLLGEMDKKSEDFWFWPCFGHLGVVK